MSLASSETGFDLKSLYSDAIKDMQVYIMFRIAKKVADLTPGLVAKDRAPIKLSIGAPVIDPPKVLLDVLKQAINTPGLHGYSTPKGEGFFLEAVQKRMQDRFGVVVNPKTEVMSLLGSKEGLANIFRALITYKSNPAEQDVIMIPDPGYASYQDSIQIAGGQTYAMRLTPENDYKPDFEDMLADMHTQGIQPERVKALVLCYPNAPIGATCGLDYYEKAVAFCKKHHILLISDLAYADVYFPGEEPPHSVLEIPGAMDVTLEFHSLSKPYSATGWRMGYAVGHADAIEALERVKGTVDSGMFKCVQKAAAFVMNSPECFEFALTQNKVYQENQAIMLKGFDELGWPIQNLSVPKATFYLWLPIPPWAASSEAFCDALLETSGIVTVPGTAFGQYGEGYFRMSLVDTQDKLHEAIARMKTDGFTFTR